MSVRNKKGKWEIAKNKNVVPKSWQTIIPEAVQRMQSAVGESENYELRLISLTINGIEHIFIEIPATESSKQKVQFLGPVY